MSTIDDTPVIYDYIGEKFYSDCSRYGFVVTARGIDRHGSLVWEAGRRDSLNRYVTLGITALPDTPNFVEEIRTALDNVANWRISFSGSRSVYSVELFIAVDDGERFARLPFAASHLVTTRTGRSTTLVQLASMPPLDALLADCFNAAIKLSRTDLSELLVMPRARSFTDEMQPGREWHPHAPAAS